MDPNRCFLMKHFEMTLRATSWMVANAAVITPVTQNTHTYKSVKSRYTNYL